ALPDSPLLRGGCGSADSFRVVLVRLIGAGYVRAFLAACGLAVVAVAPAGASPVDLNFNFGDLPFPQDQLPAELTPVVEALRTGKSEEALRRARAFVKSQPTSVVGYEVLGEAAVRRQQWREAEDALSTAVRLDPTRLTSIIRLGVIALA